MLRLTEQLWMWLRGGTFRLLVLAGLILLGWGVLAPVGTLVWWLSQSTESLGLKQDQPVKLPASGATSSTQSSPIDCYIVFLPGVGDFSTNQLTPGEERFLDSLVQQHPNCATVRDVFPYSAANHDLSGERLLAPLWQAVEQADGWLKNADVLIKIRNLWRFAIAADDRYGPVYNQGIANAIIDRMNAAHPLPRSPQQPLNIILVGTSGGVQVALGAVSYLDQWLDARLTVVSMGGTFSGEHGFDALDRMYHLHGERDWVEDIGQILFASRWRLTVGSPFNQARRQGRYVAMSSGPHAHDGEEGYFGLAIAKLPQTRYVEMTLQQTNQLPIWSVQP